MDTAMRDMELIQERSDEDSPGRKAAMLGMAGLSTIGLVFAMGVVLGDRGDAPTEPDPLAALAPAIAETEEAEQPAENAPAEDTLAPGEVRFHEQLTDERPEVEAALAAAAAEQELLARTPAPTTDTLLGQTVAPPVAPAHAPLADVARAPTELADGDGIRAASAGHDGAFTLQVASYRTREEADLFSEALRGRGHESFVTRAELPGRGTYFRVRIGPFDSRVAADRYRATFEREEAMNTYVVDSARVAANLASAAD